jgi:hypothetical protein
MGILVEVASLAAFHIGLLLVYCTVAIQIFTADFIDTVNYLCCGSEIYNKAEQKCCWKETSLISAHMSCCKGGM